EAVLGADFEASYADTEITGSAGLTVPIGIDGGDADPISADFSAELIRALSAEQNVSATLSYTFENEDPISAAVDNSISLTPGQTVLNQPSTQTLSGTIGYQRPIGPVVIDATLGASRTLLGDVTFDDGSTVSQSDLNSTSFTAGLRAGLDTGAVLTPFVEAEASLRRLDEALDVNGVDRNARQLALRGGFAWDTGEKFSGELGVGYLFEDVSDASLDDLAGLSLAAELAWSPRRTLDFGLALATETRPTGLQNSAGSIVYSADITAAYQARANLELSGALGIEHENGFGEQTDATSVSGQVGATYWFNRFAGVTGRVGYDRTFSSDEVRQSDELSVFMGLRLQR
ncbi:MAG: outer membrane beta-barrel protein, partial [Pseudomonadota bacterium]